MLQRCRKLRICRLEVAGLDGELGRERIASGLLKIGGVWHDDVGRAIVTTTRVKATVLGQ